MESAPTPYQEVSESIQNCENSNPQNTNDYHEAKQQKKIEEKDEKIIIKFGFANYVIIIILTLSIALLSGLLSIFGKEASLTYCIIGIIHLLICLFVVEYKMEITKDKINNKIYIKMKNFLLMNKLSLSFNQGNIYFHIKKIEEEEYISTKLYIINNFNNLENVDLENSNNIKIKPEKLIYDFENISSNDLTENKLNEFVGSPENYENPLTFDITLYKENQRNNLNNTLKKYNFINRCMKLKDNFYTIYFNYTPKSLNNHTHFLISILYNIPLFVIGVIVFFCVEGDIIGKSSAFIFILIINIFEFLFYKCKKLCSKKDNSRIDFIYSKDFEKIFIGIVDYNEKSYITNFNFYNKEIDKFLFLASEGGKFFIRDFYSLFIKLNNGNKVKLCTIQSNNADIEGITYLLNEKLYNNNINNDLTHN